MRISDWSSDVCSSDLRPADRAGHSVRHRTRGNKTPHEQEKEMEVSANRINQAGFWDELPPRWSSDDEESLVCCSITDETHDVKKIGQASSRERVCQYV